MRHLALVLALVGCHKSAGGIDGDVVQGGAEVCPTSGSHVALRQIAFGCSVAGAPASPGCIAGGLTLVASPPGDPRLFALEQSGRIRIIDHEQVVAAPFLDLSEDSNGPVVAGGEQGLLGLAFHPQYATNHQFFVDYTALNPDRADTANPWVDVVARYTAGIDPNVADLASGTIILSIPDFAPNHNGGMIEFGADGMLYVSTGDGGSANDPHDNGQNPDALLAKMLRLDVDHPAGGKPYGIPADNPFVAGGGAPEVFILGLRNPWRWSFDRANGDMWIGDVGQGTIEEVDMLPAGQQAGANLGWSMFEGGNCFKQPCAPGTKVFPQIARTHDIGWTAVIGGQVYRGACYPDLVGTYFFTDNGRGHMSTAKPAIDGSLDAVELPGDFIASPSSLHEDARGELYETDTLGNIFEIVASP